MIKMSFFTILLICLTYALTNGQIADNSIKFIQKIYDQCSSKEELLKCFKVQALKATDRALRLKTFSIIEGVTLISDRTGKTLQTPPLNESKLEQLQQEEIDKLLLDRTSRFFNGHTLEVKIPKLVEEARKKKGGNNGALLWALAIKGSFLAMAYQGIAVMSGTALIVGKMALLLAAILGLKKLVSRDNHEKTTFEIVKVPKYTESHSHSSSYEEEAPYHRSLDLEEKFGLKTNPYRSHYPKA